MSLNEKHRTHIHHVFYQLSKERGWSIGFPTTFRWNYLPIEYKHVQSRLYFDGNQPVIEIHPLAFYHKHLVKGLIHHELCHYMLGIEEGHSQKFIDYEQEWQFYYFFKEKTLTFARMLSRNQHKFIYTCLHCEQTFMQNNPIKGAVCRSCCEKHAKGNYDERFILHIGGVTLNET
jgi:predicted SprT family Zn-dependent metalloprotease